jgi:hypothetical protein
VTPRKPAGFWENVVKLSRNPLGIIGLTISCVYGIEVYGFSSTAAGDPERVVLTWFTVIYPFFAGCGLYRLITTHHTKFYGPGDFRDEGTFERLTESQRQTPPAPPGEPPLIAPPNAPTPETFTHSSQYPIDNTVYGNGPYGMELMILNTLWTHQVNLSPTFKAQWCFRINANTPVFLPFREASNRLIGRSLVTETDQGMICLTHAGFSYCKQYNQTFPKEQFYPETPINLDSLQEAMSGSSH